MDNERKKVPYITGFLKEFATIFTLMILCTSLTGKLILGYYPEIQYSSSLFSLGVGLPYTTILQSAFFALIMSAVTRFLFSEKVALKIPFIFRSLLYLFVTLLTASVFSLIFKWIPANNIQAWLYFFLFFFVFYFIAIGLSFIILKIEDKKYNKLLANYKNKYKD